MDLIPFDGNTTFYRKSVDCGCGHPDHRLVVEYIDDDKYATISLRVGTDGFIDRVRAAWRVLVGKYDQHDVVLNSMNFPDFYMALTVVGKKIVEN